ncbi:MAG: DNA methylase [Bacilli bacterium]|nr:DNA methylase [Bacilli bacterium]
MDRIYMCIDLKSFFASVECVERKLNPLDTNLVVADISRTEKTVCLAITPSLKQYGLGGRARLYEVVSKVKEVNKERKKNNNYKSFKDKSYIDSDLKKDKSLELDYIVAPPRLKTYMKYSTDIYNIYQKYISKEDILVYSIDEVFCDITTYLKLYKLTPEQLVTKMIMDVYNTTGITATAGIGTNMYLAKIAMDISAKHMEANEYGVRIAYLDEQKYKETLWDHLPLTDFWSFGRGTVKKLNDNGMYTMGDLARMSLENENKLFKLFGVGAEFLIDHAWGYEPCTIKDAKSYRPKSSSLSNGQVLHVPYNAKDAKLITKEMMDNLVLEMVKKRLLTSQLSLTINYDIKNLEDDFYKGEVTIDHYGRKVPKYAHGTINLDHYTSSTKIITDKISKLYDDIVNKDLLIRKITIGVNDLIYDDEINKSHIIKQLDLFTGEEKEIINEKEEKKEKKVQDAIIKIQSKYGKNAILKGMNLEEKSTAIRRNSEVGGHKE